MITNPQVGQRIIVIDRRLDRGTLYGQKGTVQRLGVPYLEIKMDDILVYPEPLLLNVNEIERIEMTPEELEQMRREQHADKYL